MSSTKLQLPAPQETVVWRAEPSARGTTGGPWLEAATYFIAVKATLNDLNGQWLNNQHPFQKPESSCSFARLIFMIA